MDRMFRQSGLMRAKWDRNARSGETYGEGTIREAIEGTTDTYGTRVAAHNDEHNEANIMPTQRKGGDKGERKAPTQADIMDALTKIGYSFRTNELDDTVEVNGQPISDGIAATIRAQMRDRGFASMKAVEDAYAATAHTNRFHPVKQYLEGLKWDGESHLLKLASFIDDAHEPIRYPDGTTAPVFPVYLSRWLIGAVAKVYEGGQGNLHAQNGTLVLDGGQGLGKSSFALWLGSPLPHLTCEEAVNPDSTEHVRWLASKWIWEIPELGNVARKQDREALKAFLSRQECTFRVPYARHAVTKPALASFIGTVNNEVGFFTDPTGNRRFLTVKLTRLDWRYADKVDVHQLWAEAFHRYQQGKANGTRPWELTATERTTRDSLNETFEVEDAYATHIVRLYEVVKGEDAKSSFAYAFELVEALKQAGLREGNDRAMFTRVGVACRRLGLEQKKKRPEGSNVPVSGYYGLRPRTKPFDAGAA